MVEERSEEMGERKGYTKAFRLQASRLVVEDGYSQREAATKLGVSTWSLRRWIEKFQRSGELTTKDDPHPAAEELKTLRAENRRLRMENEILKKAAAYFAKESM